MIAVTAVLVSLPMALGDGLDEPHKQWRSMSLSSDGATVFTILSGLPTPRSLDRGHILLRFVNPSDRLPVKRLPNYSMASAGTAFTACRFNPTVMHRKSLPRSRASPSPKRRRCPATPRASFSHLVA